jgi:F-type H+-transporting ATPase subunit alpha
MNAAPENLQSVFDRTCSQASARRWKDFTAQFAPREVGTITSISTGIAKVSGLQSVGFEELVTLPGGVSWHRLQCG